MSHADALRWLTNHRTHEDAWAYRVGGPAHGEPTLLAIAAGAPEPRIWLDTADLGWAELLLPAAVGAPPRPEARLQDFNQAPSLSEAQLASLARRELALQHILQAHGEPAGVPGEFDGTLIGWSWVEGTFSWIQPTAWALLSLRHAGLLEHERYVEGLAILVDRQCEDGGWNHGNPDSLGKELPGYLYLTGWALLALEPGHPAAAAGLHFLEGVRTTPSTTNLSTAILARLAHGQPVDEELALLTPRQLDDGSFGEAIERTTIAACALRAVELGDCPLVISPPTAPDPVDTEAPSETQGPGSPP